MKHFLRIPRGIIRSFGMRACTVALVSTLVFGMTACGKKDATTEPLALRKPDTSESETVASTATEVSDQGGELKNGEVYSKLTGLPVPEDIGNQRIIAVMFDNHPDARPQAGLSEADIVFEMKVEGTYTRYMGLFQTNAPDRVGPVRSARDCFLDRMLDFDAVYAHFGGSYTALQRIKQYHYADLDGMGNAAQAMRRDDSTGKTAPHNVYASITQLRDTSLANGNHPENRSEGMNFATKAYVPDGEDATDIKIDFASDNHTSYTWDPEAKAYTRFKDGTQDIDENNQKPILATNIIIQKATSYIFAPPLRKIELIGQGEGYFISNGKVIPIKWDKSSEIGATFYTDENGNSIKLNPGQTWIEVVDPDTPVDIK